MPRIHLYDFSTNESIADDGSIAHHPYYREVRRSDDTAGTGFPPEIYPATNYFP